jgi:hypothetical protein
MEGHRNSAVGWLIVTANTLRKQKQRETSTKCHPRGMLLVLHLTLRILIVLCTLNVGYFNIYIVSLALALDS